MLNRDTIEVLPLFPTPLFTAVYTEGDLDKTIDFLDGLEMADDKKPKEYGLVSRDTHVLDNEECKPLSNFIMECTLHFCNNVLLYDYEEYRFSQSWVSHKAPNQAHTLHAHANSLISGVFYYGEEDRNMPAICFHKPFTSINTCQLSPKYKLDRRSSEFAWDFFNINYTQGLLLLFPSYLHHSVPLNTTKKVRKSLAFNILPIEVLGDEGNLTELLFKRFV